MIYSVLIFLQHVKLLLQINKYDSCPLTQNKYKNICYIRGVTDAVIHRED